MRIMVARNRKYVGSEEIETYSGSIVRVLRELGHEVVDIPKNLNQNYDGVDLLLDIDCGRNAKGDLIWQAQDKKLPVQSAVMFIDSHGYPTLHHRLARNYDHVFFAVYDRRDLFAGHKSAHWCPNFSDLKWFNSLDLPMVEPSGVDFGFFGSKGGLDRADSMIKIANDHNWKAVARQVCPSNKVQWPATAAAMGRCKNLFNRGQKHDSPNLRVMESMLIGRPLISDKDPRSGMDKLFTPWEHYIPYEYFAPHEGLDFAMHYVMDSPELAAEIARKAYDEVRSKHLVENRIEQILEVVK